MNVNGVPYQSIWPDPGNPELIRYIDQARLPFEFVLEDLRSPEDALEAIRSMKVRGAPLIGVTAAFGIYLACLESRGKEVSRLDEHASALREARPTAVNLAWAIERMMRRISGIADQEERSWKALEEAVAIMEEEKQSSFRIGEHGMGLIREAYRKKKESAEDAVVNILTHCNAGWLACIDYGTATAPVYLAHNEGIPVHVWVDETRPRNQGARLTAWELGKHGVPHTVVVDNAGGHLMQHGKVDLVLVGSDRTTRTGDVANKIGTYLKALAAKDCDIPFYVALPSSSIDFSIRSGIEEIEIEERDEAEVRIIEGITDGTEGQKVIGVNILPGESPVSNYGFDVTPARLVTGLITEKGICPATEAGIKKLFPEYLK